MPHVEQPTILFLERWNSADGPKDFSIQSYRTTIADLVDNFLSDLDDVAQTLIISPEASGSLRSLTMCLEFLGENSDIFLQPAPESTNHNLNQFSTEEKTSHAFCFWFLRHMLRILSRPDCKGVHDITVRLILQILHSTKMRSKFFFRQHVIEFIKTSAELIEANNHLYSGVHHVLLSCFQCDIDLAQQSLKDPTKQSQDNTLCESKMRIVDMVLSSTQSCELLQVNIVKILQRIVLDIVQFASSHVDVVWGCLCCHLEEGDVDLKTVSLNMLTSLLSMKRPPLPVSEHFLSCIIGLWELLCEQDTPLNNSERVVLEGASAGLLNSLVENDELGYLASKPRFFRQLAEKLSRSSGFHNLSCLGARQALIRLFVHQMRVIPQADLHGQVNKPALESLVFHSMSIIGSSKCCLDYLVPLLAQLILVDNQLVRTSVDSFDTTTSSTQSGITPARRQTTGLLSRKRKKIEELPAKEANFPVFNCLLDKLTEFSTDKGPPTSQELECLHLVIQVASRCLSQLCGKIHGLNISSRYPLLTETVINLAIDCWTRYLRSVSSEMEPGSKFGEHYFAILHSIASVLVVNDIHPMPPMVLQELSWMVSLPWIANDMSWKDMKPSKPKEVAMIASKLTSKLDHDCVCMCLKTLILLPREICSSWKTHIITQAMSDNRLDTSGIVVQCFPLLLYNLGPKSNHLVESLLIPMLDAPTTACFNIAKNFGMVVTVMSEVARMDRPEIDDFTSDIDVLRMVGNSEYDKHQLKEKGKNLNLGIINSFLVLLKHSDAIVRKNTLHSMSQIFDLLDLNHSGVKNMINACLNLMEDEEPTVRLGCCNLISHLVSEQARKVRLKPSTTDRMVWKRLELVCTNASDQSKQQLQETALQSVGQFGRLVEGELLEAAIVCLLESRLSRQLLVAAVAFEELQNIASHKKESLQQIYVRFKKAICKFLVEAMYTDQMNCDGFNAKNILINVASTLAAEDLKAFLQGGEKYILPFLVSKASPQATKLIRLIASLQSSTHIRRSLLINNTKYIFSYLVRSCQKEEMERALLYLQAETDFSLGNLLRLDFQRVHNELLLHLSTHYQQVFNGLKTLAAHDEQYKGPKDINTSEQMAQYLEPRLLGVLAFFDSQLMNSNITLEDKELALKSVISILNLMGSKHISSIPHKVMNTLRLGLQFKEASFVEISCRAWNCFVRSLELPLLGVMMSQIIATLLPLLQSLPGQVAQIFNYMIVENRAALSKRFHEIYFLPDIPELADANAVLKQLGDSSASEKDLKTLLAHSIKGINHESLDVRAHALSKLKTLLYDRRTELSNYVLNNEPAESIVSDLVSALLSGCRETGSNTQLLYGQCLGELGAVDPGRLELITRSPDVKLANFHSSIDEDNFAFGLIMIVVKAFLAATEPRVQDSAAFALQELLQIYHISEQGEGQGVSPHNKLWKRFPEQTQEILVPLLNSKYKLSFDAKYSNYPKPLYGSDKGKNFKDWVSNWTGYLISKVKPGKACQVFTACSATKRHNKQVALYVLPHVVLHVLQDGTQDDVTEMFDELMEVLQHMKKPVSRQESASDFHHLSAQTVFSILDYLTMWRSHCMQVTTAGSTGTKVAAYEKDSGYQAVNGFLERIPQEIFAQACYNCKAYTRALRHFEMFVASSQNIQQHLDFMQRLYVSMDEPDGVLGVAAVRVSQPTLMQQILTHESLGQQQDAQACYERAIQMEPEEISHHHGLLRSLIDLAQPNKALIHTAGILADRPRWTAQLNSYRIEAAWKLGSWETLEEALKTEKHGHNNWPVLVGRILLASKEKQEVEFVEQLELARREQMGPLSAASMEIGSYHRGYENILRLHMINEIEEFFQTLVDFPEKKDIADDIVVVPSTSDLLTHWQARLQMAQSTFRTQEPILTLRRTLLSLIQSEREASLSTQIGKWWLWSAKVARKAGYLQSAYGCLLQANSYNLPEFNVEKAKWLWEKGEPDAAISCLDKGITEHFGHVTDSANREQLSQSLKQVYAQSLLLYGKYSEETSNLETNSIVKLYKDVIDVCPEWEDGHFYLAKYYDRIMTTIIDDKDRAEKQGEFIIHVVRNFGHSLKYGNQHIYQSMPRLLSLWLDYGTSVAESEKRDRGKQTHKLQVQRTVLKRINMAIKELSEQLAPYQMFTAFPQLISRICHAQPDVFQQLEELISDLLIKYPQQAMWMMMAVSKSSYPMRVKRCQDIFVAAVAKNEQLNKFIQDCKKLTDRLLELCEKDFGNSATVSLSQTFKPLKRLLEDSNFSQILLPLQSAVAVKLPATVCKDMQHSPFPDNQIYIRGFDDMIEVLPSLQKPKKITMIGSDGQRYVMMCKPKDDLRKDCRLMEFNTIINRFLRRDAESRRRRLLIRTYTVTPLNEECGLIEWVNNTTGLRHILVKLYKERGLYMSGKELKAVMPALHSSLENKMKVYKEKLLPRHPPLFPEWFMRTFPDPTSWYSARVSYARTAAVMSIVGYILGLGDRHGENILLDSTTGDCVHVDFNCLFNKGETFEWAERVPFRLTPNMTAALGPLGYEGLFRRACEMTLKVIRDQMDPLMSVLKPFIYDPLVEWSKPARGQRSNATESGEINNELALNHVQNIEDRMRGILKTKTKPRCLPLSIEGHVNYLIQEAIDEKNLCQMYIGWAAYM